MRPLLMFQIKPGMVLAENVYDNDKLLIPKSAFLSEHMIDVMRSRGITHAYIVGHEGDERIYVPKQELTIKDEFKGKAVENIEDLFRMIENDPHSSTAIASVVKNVDSVVENLVQSIVTEQDAFVNISNLKDYDEYTYHHSLSVAVLSIAIGQELGFSTEKLNKLGLTAILHDIGKTSVPIGIINKPSRLEVSEYELVKTHSPEGYKYLSRLNIGDREILRGVLFHHESYDGSGYPFGLSGDKIPDISRIISIADVYDALTSNRPYRTPMQPYEAIEYIFANASTQFDYDFVLAFSKKIELYPVGSFVELSTGGIAVVINNTNTLRPTVMMLDTKEVLDLEGDFKCHTILLKRIVPAEEISLPLRE